MTNKAEDRTYAVELARKANAELALIENGREARNASATWRSVDYLASAPVRGVTLDGGPLCRAFERNIYYLNDWFARKLSYQKPSEAIGWEVHLPASSEGRMLNAAANTLRWGERPDMRCIVDALVTIVKERQRDDGYCMPFPEAEMAGSTDGWIDERRNYDRVNLTRGMVAAALVGNEDALPIMRRYYDWLNASPYLAKLLLGTFDRGTAHNCNNGHEGHLLMYFSAVGKAEDLLAAERHFIQDFFIDESIRGEPRSLSHYPFHVAHSYVLLAYKAWLDHYRATGSERYLDAVRGAWQIVHDNFLHIGGSLAICEHTCGSYPPGSYYIHVDQEHHTGETCGSVFWADINHRLLQLLPEEVKYADEIELAIFNTILAAQDEAGRIRYHARLQAEKEEARSINTCCEVMGSPFIASLPQYIYATADDGIYVYLFAPSSITWNNSEKSLTMRCATDFPSKPEVELSIEAAEPVIMNLRIRAPGWAKGAMTFIVNDEPFGDAEPGSIITINRQWSQGDVVRFTVPMVWRTELYAGADEHPIHPRHALLFGPILMALLGADDLDMTPSDLVDRLHVDEEDPLIARIDGLDGAFFIPYWRVKQQSFSCFPTLRTYSTAFA